MNRITGTVTYGARMPWAEQDEWKRRSNGWTVEIRYQRRRMTVDFWTGSALDEPSIADVVYCLVSDSSVEWARSFEDWADDYGYDTDSRKAEATYRACVKQTEALRRVLGDALDDARQADDPEQWAKARTKEAV